VPRRVLFPLCPLVALILLASGSALSASAQVPGVGASAQIRDASGQVVATAEFREGRNEVLVTLIFSSPPALGGTHAVHIHEVGRCDPPDFSSSGAIFNPLNKQHGRQNPEGAEAGDLPNVNFSNGLTAYNTTAIGATLAAGTASLLSPPRSVVIFSGEDDQKTGPEGNAGARIACGVIQAGASAAVASPSAAPRVVVVVSPSAVARPAGSSPVAVVSKPVATTASATPVLAAALPTPISVVAGTQTSQPATGLSATNALILAVLGAALIIVGYLLRQSRPLPPN
jgi:superoxide dismutase, Cu-Zn family